MDGRERKDLAGVAAVVAGVVFCAAVVDAVSALFPNKELPVFAKKPDDGAAAVVVL